MTTRTVLGRTCIGIGLLALLTGWSGVPAVILICIGAWVLRPYRPRPGPLDAPPF